MIGLLGAVNIPFYEQMARRIHWWQYGGCRMISLTPWYIIVGEFGIAVVFALLARTLRRGSVRTAIMPESLAAYRFSLATLLPFLLQTD